MYHLIPQPLLSSCTSSRFERTYGSLPCSGVSCTRCTLASHTRTKLLKVQSCPECSILIYVCFRRDFAIIFCILDFRPKLKQGTKYHRYLVHIIRRIIRVHTDARMLVPPTNLFCHVSYVVPDLQCIRMFVIFFSDIFVLLQFFISYKHLSAKP